MYNSLSPDLKRQADAIRAARRAQENTSTDARTQAARQASDDSRPRLWRLTGLITTAIDES